MRLLCVVVLLAATACGPFGAPGGGSRGTGNGTATPVASPTAAVPSGPAALLVQLASPSTYAVSLVFDDGSVVGPATARLRTVPPGLPAGAPAAMPVVSASDTRLYYLDGDTDVRYLRRDGTSGSAARLPGGPRMQAGFAVRADDQRIAVSAVDLSTVPHATRLYVEDMDGTNHVDLPLPSGVTVWPVGWHGTQLVVAVGSAPTQSTAANPYGTFAGYQLVDGATGGRLGTLSCNPAGPLTPAGSACLVGGSPLAVQDLAGRTRALPGAPSTVVSAAEAPDGARVAFCCDGGQLRLWDLRTDSVTSLGPADSPAYGWIDATHLLISDAPAQHPRVMDVTSGSSLPVAASLGRVVGRLPGGL